MTARAITLTVNGRSLTAPVEPRRHLADFLREQLLLTGTHLGCEHGVCGACTVIIDGQIARSCITFAVACEGAEVRTIEGLDDDPVTTELRQAFTEEHGLQCGYCTPGMLITARDIVTRLPHADEARVRQELSGNLCRCTGYAGIVAAVCRVLAARKVAGEPAVVDSAPMPVTRLGRDTAQASPDSPPTASTTPAIEPMIIEPTTTEPEAGANTLSQSFVVRHPRDRVWRTLRDVERVATCMPGAGLTGPVRDNKITGQISVKLGPMRAAFAGDGTLRLDEASYQGAIEGSGRDKHSATRAKGRVTYSLFEEQDGAATRVDVSVAYTLAGPLAQFSRAGIVTDLARRLTAAFAANLQDRLDAGIGGQDHASSPAMPATAETSLDAGSLLLSVIWARIKALFASIARRS